MSETSPSRAIVDLNAYANNIAMVRRFIGAQTQIIAVVKANAYGHGMLPIAQKALTLDIPMLAVATVDEGISLRQAGIDIQFDRGRGKGRRRLITLEKSRILPSDMSEPSESARNNGAANAVSDMSDGSDSKIHPYSCEDPCHAVNEEGTHD